MSSSAMSRPRPASISSKRAPACRLCQAGRTRVPRRRSAWRARTTPWQPKWRSSAIVSRLTAAIPHDAAAPAEREEREHRQRLQRPAADRRCRDPEAPGARLAAAGVSSEASRRRKAAGQGQARSRRIRQRRRARNQVARRTGRPSSPARYARLATPSNPLSPRSPASRADPPRERSYRFRRHRLWPGPAGERAPDRADHCTDAGAVGDAGVRVSGADGLLCGIGQLGLFEQTPSARRMAEALLPSRGRSPIATDWRWPGLRVLFRCGSIPRRWAKAGCRWSRRRGSCAGAGRHFP